MAHGSAQLGSARIGALASLIAAASALGASASWHRQRIIGSSRRNRHRHVALSGGGISAWRRQHRRRRQRQRSASASAAALPQLAARRLDK